MLFDTIFTDLVFQLLNLFLSVILGGFLPA